MSSSLFLTVPPADNTLGALLVGAALASLIFGLNMNQTFRYFVKSDGDSEFLKGTVMALVILDVFHQALTIHMCYYYMISSFFIPTTLLTEIWSIRLVVTVTGLITMVAHLFFVRRVCMLSGHRKILPLLAGLVIMAETAFCIGATVTAFIDVTFSRFQNENFWMIYAALGIRVAVDVVHTVALIYYLHKSRTEFKKTNKAIDVLILYAINTGLLTSLISLITLVVAVTIPHNFVYIATYLVSSKLYTASVLAVLNSRQFIRRRQAGKADSVWTEVEERISLPRRKNAKKAQQQTRQTDTEPSIEFSAVKVSDTASSASLDTSR